MIGLPATFAADIADLIHGVGEPVTFQPAEGGAPTEIVASVQQSTDLSLVQDADQQLLTVYVAGADLVAPLKFDRLVFRGYDHAIEDVHADRDGARVLAWRLLVRG